MTRSLSPVLAGIDIRPGFSMEADRSEVIVELPVFVPELCKSTDHGSRGVCAVERNEDPYPDVEERDVAAVVGERLKELCGSGPRQARGLRVPRRRLETAPQPEAGTPFPVECGVVGRVLLQGLEGRKSRFDLAQGEPGVTG